MRNAAQLRADAIATGTFDAYVGDGASVPWLEAGLISTGASVLLYAYKLYLDSRWPHAFKLHDWAYTPFGGLIDCQRIEADHALYEEIAVDSPLDAWVVYLAVRAGGGPWFGRSQTGYSGVQVLRATPNIANTQSVFLLGDP